MAKGKLFNIRDKRKQPRPEWKRSEVLHAVILFALLLAFCLWLAFWFVHHHFD